ncbi:MAG TPA: hypothetical protein VGT41_06115 [Candidatus Babeliales bacterium]|nr:hypothetical protein [Candidatus Babeliales bacterium]
MTKKNYNPLLNLACIILLLGSTHNNCETSIDLQEKECTAIEHGPQLSNNEISQLLAALKQELADLYPLIKNSPEAFTEFKRLTAKIIVLAKYLEAETEEEHA